MIIIQLLKDTKYPANYQIIIDSSLGNYAVLRDFFSALAQTVGAHAPREWEGARKRSAAGGMERSGSLCGKLPLRGGPCMEDNAAASGSSCELANPAQVRQIASQTGVLFSAG